MAQIAAITPIKIITIDRNNGGLSKSLSLGASFVLTNARKLPTANAPPNARTK